MTTTEDFIINYTAAETLMYGMTKEQLMEVCRLLAANLARYKNEYGELPFQEVVDKIRFEHLDEGTEAMLSKGMQDLVDALNVVLSLRSSGGPGLEYRDVH